jgi:chromosome segregation ATPase
MYAMGMGSLEEKLDELGRRVEMLTFTLKLHQDFVERIAVVLHRNKSDDGLDQLFERVEKLAAERDKALADVKVWHRAAQKVDSLAVENERLRANFEKECVWHASERERLLKEAADYEAEVVRLADKIASLADKIASLVEKNASLDNKNALLIEEDRHFVDEIARLSEQIGEQEKLLAESRAINKEAQKMLNVYTHALMAEGARASLLQAKAEVVERIGYARGLRKAADALETLACSAGSTSESKRLFENVLILRNEARSIDKEA